MAKTSMKIKQQRKPKFSTQAYTRCKICGRPHSVLLANKIYISLPREFLAEFSETKRNPYGILRSEKF